MKISKASSFLAILLLIGLASACNEDMTYADDEEEKERTGNVERVDSL